MHAPEYIRAIWEGDVEEAVRQIYRSNPFSQVCGRVCTHRCEDLSREYIHSCREGELDSYFVLPDPNGMHGEHFEKGWAKTEDADLIELERQPMSEMDSD